jgi:hypothetical protein
MSDANQILEILKKLSQSSTVNVSVDSKDEELLKEINVCLQQS